MRLRVVWFVFVAIAAGCTAASSHPPAETTTLGDAGSGTSSAVSTDGSTATTAAFGNCGAATTSMVYFNGDDTDSQRDYIHPGIETIVPSATRTISAVATPIGAAPYTVSMHVEYSDKPGNWWDLDFSTVHIPAVLEDKTYTGAERAAFADDGHPGIDIGGTGRGCNTISGKFTVSEVKLGAGDAGADAGDDAGDAGAVLESFTATFEQHCEQGDAALYGCVHYQR